MAGMLSASAMATTLSIKVAEINGVDATGAPAAAADVLPGDIVTLEVFIRDWSGVAGMQLRGYELRVDFCSFTSGLAGNVYPKDFATTTDVNGYCTAGICAGAGCSNDGDALCGATTGTDNAGNIFTDGTNNCFGDGDPIGSDVGPWSGGNCAFPTDCLPGGAIDCQDSAVTFPFIFGTVTTGLNDQNQAINTTTLCGGRYINGLAAGAGGPDSTTSPAGAEFYIGTIVVEVSADAKGTFNVGLSSIDADANGEPDFSFLRAVDPVHDPLFLPIGFETAALTVPTGSCCTFVGGPGADCVSAQTNAECLVLDANANWTEGGVCSAPVDLAADCVECLAGDPTGNCDDGNPCTDDSCDGTGQCVNANNTASCEDGDLCTLNDACAGGSCVPGVQKDCADTNDCTTDTCDSLTGNCSNDGTGNTFETAQCEETPFPNACTFADCDGLVGGGCANTSIAGATCTTAADCQTLGGGPGTCSGGFCVCANDPQVTIDITGGKLSDGDCFIGGTDVNVAIFYQAGPIVSTAQFLLSYDPDCLTFAPGSIVAGDGVGGAVDTWDSVLLGINDSSAGTVFVAVLDLSGNGADVGTFASMRFTKNPACGECNICFIDDNPRNTILGTPSGQGLTPLYDQMTDPAGCENLRTNGENSCTCPPAVTSVNADCDGTTATVTWDAPSCSDSCEGAIAQPVTVVACPAGVDCEAIKMNGGTLPIGFYSFTSTGTDGCGVTAGCAWEVTVSADSEFCYNVQLAPMFAAGGATGITRCIEFVLYPNACQGTPVVIQEDVVFGDAFNLDGHGSGCFKVPHGQYTCVTARDPLHTLRAVADRASGSLTCGGGSFAVLYKDASGCGDGGTGNWLVGGNLDDNRHIDVVDFAILLSQFGGSAPGGANTPCGTTGPHADLNGDGLVDSADFTYISRYFLCEDKLACCDHGPAAGEQATTEITLQELELLGLGDLAAADLNADGVVNVDDMIAFMNGARPVEDASSFNVRTNKSRN